MDQVCIDCLEVTCIIGCGAPERIKAQRIQLYLTLFFDVSLCGRTDALEHTVNYAALSKRVEEVCQSSQSFTLEHLCTLVAREALFGPASCNGMAQRVRVRIEKPEVLKRAKWPAVEIERSRGFFEAEDARWGPPSAPGVPCPLPPTAMGAPATALLCLGSNVGLRERNLRLALRLLAGEALQGTTATSAGAAASTLPAGTWLRVEATSFLYQTAPAYVTDQPPFLNAAARVSTNLTPLQLLAHIKEHVEGALGRPAPGQPGYARNGPRCIDVDIALWGGGLQVSEGEAGALLTIPHPRLTQRDFVLVPLVDIAPNELHPAAQVTLAQLLARLPGYGGAAGAGAGAEGLSGSVQRVLVLPGWEAGSSGSGSGSGGGWGGPEHVLPLGARTYVMGILNVTPDSFSDGGQFTVEDGKAAAQAAAMVAQGVDIIDIGGQSTRPGAVMLSAAEELARTLPAITAVRAAVGPSVLLSVDTFYASVARAAVAAGANLVNDVTGGRGDAGMPAALAELGVPYICMHSRGTDGGSSSSSESALSSPADGSTVYSTSSSCSSCSSSSQPSPAATALETTAVVKEVCAWLGARAGELESSGLPRWSLVLDPGLGFSKRPLHSFALLAQGRGAYAPPGYPVLAGPSRKGFLGAATGAADPKGRQWATAAAVSAAIGGGCDLVRVHDVAEMVQVCRVADAVYRGYRE